MSIQTNSRLTEGQRESNDLIWSRVKDKDIFEEVYELDTGELMGIVQGKRGRITYGKSGQIGQKRPIFRPQGTSTMLFLD